MRRIARMRTRRRGEGGEWEREDEKWREGGKEGEGVCL